MVIRQATVFTGVDFIPDATVHIQDGRIREVSTTAPVDATAIDFNGDYLVPGFVDLQLYGGSDQFLNASPTPDTVRHMQTAHLRSGTTSLVPTVFSAPHSTILQAAEAVRTVMRDDPFGVLGLHIEGPYISPEKRGVHSLDAVQPPNLTELTELFTRYPDVLSMLTVAPECFTPSQWTWLINNKPAKLRLSAGHSNATYQEAFTAFNNGATLATHLYNAMRGFESREPGVVGAVFDHPTVRSSLVADGFHCDPVAIRLAHRLLGDRLFLISDALLVGDSPAPFPLTADTTVQYQNGRLVNQEGKLAGSAITLFDAVRVCVEQAEITLSDALRMASTIPAEVAGYGDSLGKIQPGYVANLVRLDLQLACKEVWVNGQRQLAT